MADQKKLKQLLEELDSSPSKNLDIFFKALNEESIKSSDGMDIFHYFFIQVLNKLKEPTSQIGALRKLQSELNNKISLKGYCCSKKWLQRSLKFLSENYSVYSKEVIEEIFKVIKSLTLFSIESDSLKQLFQLVSEAWTDPNVLSDIFASHFSRDDPKSFFDFSGAQTGLIIPMANKKFPTKGFSFLVWIRIENFPTGSLSNPRLFSYANQNDALEAFFEDSNLVLATQNLGKKEQYSFEFNFEEKHWYLIVIKYEYNLIRKSQVSLIVDGKTESGSISYPKFSNNPSNFYIGCNGSLDGEISHLTDCINAQFGVIMLLEQEISMSDYKKLQEMGPLLTPIMNDDKTEVIFGQQKSSLIIDRRVVSKIIFSYHPQATLENVCFDTSHYSKIHQAKRINVKNWHIFNFQSTLHSSGGFKALFLMFHTNSDLSIVSHDPIVFFNLFKKILESYPVEIIEKELTESSFFPVLGHILEQISDKITIQSLEILEATSDFILKSFKEGILFQQLIKYVILNFRIWFTTTLDIQNFVWNIIRKLVNDAYKFFRTQITIQTFIDILRLFYFLKPSSDLKIEPSILKKRPTIDQLIELRKQPLEIIIVICEENLKSEEIIHIINYLRACDEMERKDIFEILGKLLNQYFDQSDYLVSYTNIFKNWNSHVPKSPSNLIQYISVPYLVAYDAILIRKKWKQILRFLHPNTVNTWKLDNTENSNRMRRRLKQQFSNPVQITSQNSQTTSDINPFREKENLRKNIREELTVAQGIIETFSSKSEECFRQGFLFTKKLKKTLLYTLKNNSLEPKQDSKNPKIINLVNAKICVPEIKHIEFAFEITTEDSKVHVFCTNSRLEMEEWVRDITYVICRNSSVNPIPQLSQNMIVADLPPTPVVFKSECSLVTPIELIPGIIEFSGTQIRFIGKDKFKTWEAKLLREIYRRYYLLQNTALEIFLRDQTSIFFNFSMNDIVKVLERLLAFAPHLINCASIPPEKLISKVTKRWITRKISNFEYLIALNTISGRTFNDLNQYPVFPWILTDYTSKIIDLTNKNVYRDLSKPVGALNSSRLEQFIERYNSFVDEKIPKFHYGTHYSNLGMVLSYLMRIEPYTSYCIKVGGGKFDHPDRMFVSIQRTWNSCFTTQSNVGELIPEFFYFPEFLVNGNNRFFGNSNVLGSAIGDVTLPPWAKTPEEFIHIHREALESEYVSEHLNEWIDLIFGYKQKGPAAVEAFNTFFYLTYPGAINLDSIQDPIEKKSIETQILNFGQCPNQLFTAPHPKRKPLAEVPAKMDAFRYPNKLRGSLLETISSAVTIESPPTITYLPGSTDEVISKNSPNNSPILSEEKEFENKSPSPKTKDSRYLKLSNSLKRSIKTNTLKRNHISGSLETPIHHIEIHSTKVPVISILCHDQRVVLILEDGTVLVNFFKINTGKSESPFVFTVDKIVQSQKMSEKTLQLMYSREPFTHSNSFSFLNDKILVSCLNWTDSINLYLIQENTNLIRFSQSLVLKETPLAVAFDGVHLACACLSGHIYIYLFDAKQNNLNLIRTIVGCGNFHTLSCIDVLSEEDLVIVGSTESCCQTFAIQSGTFIRSISLTESPKVVRCCGQLIATLSTSNSISLHSINGKPLASIDSGNFIVYNDIRLTSDGQYLIAVGVSLITVFQTSELKILNQYPIEIPARSVELSSDQQFIFVGLMNGDIIILPLEKSSFL